MLKTPFVVMLSIQNDGLYLTVVPTKAPHAGQAMWVVGMGKPGCGHGWFGEVEGVPNGFLPTARCWSMARNTSVLLGSPNPKAGAPNTEGWSTVMLQFPNRPPLVLGAELVSKGAPKGPVDLSPNAGAVYM